MGKHTSRWRPPSGSSGLIKLSLCLAAAASQGAVRWQNLDTCRYLIHIFSFGKDLVDVFRMSYIICFSSFWYEKQNQHLNISMSCYSSLKITGAFSARWLHLHGIHGYPRGGCGFLTGLTGFPGLGSTGLGSTGAGNAGGNAELRKCWALAAAMSEGSW